MVPLFTSVLYTSPMASMEAASVALAACIPGRSTRMMVAPNARSAAASLGYLQSVTTHAQEKLLWMACVTNARTERFSYFDQQLSHARVLALGGFVAPEYKQPVSLKYGSTASINARSASAKAMRL